MPWDLYDPREGRVIALCQPGDSVQTVPPLMTFKDCVAWYALENMAYTYIPFQWGWQPPVREENYGWLSDVGPLPERRLYSYRVTQPYTQANYLSYWVNPWITQIGDLDPWVPSALDLIPEDAWVDQVRFQIKYNAHPTEWEYAIHEFGHNNTLLPQSDIIIPGKKLISWYETGTFDEPPFDGDDGFIVLEDIVNPTPGTINARDACLQDFSAWVTLRHETETGGRLSAPPLLRIAYIVIDIFWLGIDTEVIDQWDGAPYDLGTLAMTGDIELQRNLDGALAGSMAVAANVNFTGGLAGGMSNGLDGIGDPTKDLGGVNDSTDTSGFFYGDLAFDAPLNARYRLDSDGNLPLDMSLSGAIDRISNIVGTIPMNTSVVFGAQLLKEGRLWVQEEDMLMSMDLGGGLTELAQTLALVGTMPCSMGLAATLNIDQKMDATFPASMAVAAPYIGMTVDIAGTPAFTMDGAAILGRDMVITGAYNAGLSFWAGITYAVESPALPENTIFVEPKNRTVYVEPKGRTLYISPRDRTAYIGQRDRTIYLDSQQGN